MGKKRFTLCLPIPDSVPQHLALDILHNHYELLCLNQVLVSHSAIDSPFKATHDERHYNWYEVEAKGNISPRREQFRIGFDDLAYGVKVHTLGPFGVDVQVEYILASEDGLPGYYAMDSGLTLCAAVDFTCPFGLAGIVRSQAKQTVKDLTERIVRRAEEEKADMEWRIHRTVHELDTESERSSAGSIGS